MDKVKFIIPYRGVLSGEVFYKPGQVGEFQSEFAYQLVREGRAELIVPEPEPDPVLAVDLDDLSFKELKAMAKERKVKGYGKMKKEQLIAELRDD